MAMPSDRSIADVLKDIVANVQHIIRAEVRLARVEVRENIFKMKRGAMFLVVAGLLGTLAVGVLLLTAVYALSQVMPPWAAALVVAVVTGVVAAVCAGTGVKSLKQIKLPPKTVATIEENIQWAKTQTK
jgi:uncharacterized membrane protein YqjE